MFLVLRPRNKSRLVLSDWSAPAMGAPPRAEKPGKPFFGNGEHLAAVCLQWLYKYYISMFSLVLGTSAMLFKLGLGTPIRQGVNCSEIF